MTEAEMKLALLRYNILSEERANAAYMWRSTGGSDYYDSVWDKCWNDMRELEVAVHSEGYKFIETGTKVKDKVQSSIYKIVRAPGVLRYLQTGKGGASS